MARVEDNWVSGAITGGESVWESSSWSERTGISVPTNGYGQAMDEVRSMPNVPISTLIDYYYEVRAATFAAIDAMSEDDVGNIDIREGRDSSWGWILGHLIVEESQHLGQVALIRGMIRGLDG